VNQGNYYIAFITLHKALEAYIPIMSFLLSLGDQPQGSKWGYTLTFIGFGFVTIYMTVTAFLLAYRGIESVAQSEGRAIQASDLFTKSMLYSRWLRCWGCISDVRGL
jgi:chitin synthase